MREIRQSGSEGGEAGNLTGLPYPYQRELIGPVPRWPFLDFFGNFGVQPLRAADHHWQKISKIHCYRNKKKGDLLELMQTPLSEIPIKKISEEDQKPLIYLVDRILDKKRVNPQVDIGNLEEEIDQLVYHLYGLTEEEIKIVEGAK